MAEKGSRPQPLGVGKPVPMKLFATWEVDRTPPNCIPRLCSLTLSKLLVIRPLGAELATITVAVKMQSSKRILRSNEMSLPASGLLDTELDLHFALQYPHFLKRDGNKLHVMLQRRKRYKHRTILGFKTLAEGVINMSQVLQRQMDLELDLLSEGKDGKGGGLVARVSVNSLCSQPVDQKHVLNDPGDRVGEFSDDDEEFASSQDEAEVENEGSDSEPMLDDTGRRMRKTQRAKMQTNARQRNLKQKFISLLKRFRQGEGLGGDQEDMDRKLSGGDMDPTEIEDLFEELDDLSESGPEMDTMSISSTPKPSLRPFFASSRSLLQETGLAVTGPPRLDIAQQGVLTNTDKVSGVDRLSDESSKGGRGDSDSHPDVWTDQDASDPPPASPPPVPRDKEPPERRSRLFQRSEKPKKSMSEQRTLTAPCLLLDAVVPPEQPRKLVLEQISRVLGSEDSLPDHVVIVATTDSAGMAMAGRLQERQLRVLPLVSPADIRPALTCLVSRIQKYCHSSAKPPSTVKVMTVGNDGFINNVLRQYVEQLSSKPPDWQNYIRFLVVPLGSSSLSRYLCSIDSTYAGSFSGDTWTKGDPNEAVARISRYLHKSTSTLLLPVAEAMLTYKDKSDDESSQIFVPFVNDVRLGCGVELTGLDRSAIGGISVEMDDAPLGGGSPPKVTPPSSPNVNSAAAAAQPSRESLTLAGGGEPLELQVDYWLAGSKDHQSKEPSRAKDSTKSSMKTSFKNLQVQRLPGLGEQPGPYFLLNYRTKEKKQQKIIRLGKKKEKEKETENKNQQVEGVSRLICCGKTHAVPLKVNIDGTEWTGVKFFQLSAQWQTHIKTFPVGLFQQDSS